MANYLDIRAYISGIVANNGLGQFYSVNMKEFANLTQRTDNSTVLFLIDSANVTARNEFTAGNRVIRSYRLTFFILKAIKDISPEEDIDIIFSSCESAASSFLWLINRGNEKIFGVDNMNTERVKFVTPNTFAGVTFTLESVKTACNLYPDGQKIGGFPYKFPDFVLE